MIDRYGEFVQRASAALIAEGGRLLYAAAPGVIGPDWVNGWDCIVLADVPGTAAVFAFTDGRGASLDELGTRIERLASGITQMSLTRSPAGIRLVAVPVFAAGLGGYSPRQIRRLGPANYYAGLRPSTWVADLATDRLFAPRGLGQEGAEALRSALVASPGFAGHEPEAIHSMQRAHLNRMNQFYLLMRSRPPIVTYALIAINVLIFLLEYASGGPDNATTLRSFGALSGQLVLDGQWWRLFSAMFLHASIPHILFNMTSLFAVGTLAERLYGSSRYLAIYLGAGLIGSLTSFGWSLASGNTDVLGVGASGAIFGVAGALLTVRFQSSDVIPQRLRNRISLSLLPLVLLSLAFSLITPYVDNGAHIGGLLGGIVLSFLLPVARSLPPAATRV